MGQRAGSEDAAAASDDGGCALHARLLARDPTAPSDLVSAYLVPLTDWLQRTFARIPDAELLDTVAADLLLGLAERPEQYDPGKGTLEVYLRMAARGDVKNALDKERRRAQHLRPLDDVELSSRARNSEWAGLTMSRGDPAHDAHDDTGFAERLAALREHFDARDWPVVELMIEHERRTEAYVPLLGLEGRPAAEQAREVKRVKDRLQKRIRRLWTRGRDDD